MSLKKISARDAAIIENYRQTRSLRDTGAAFGLSLEWVRQIVKRHEPDLIAPPHDIREASRRRGTR